MKRAPISFSTRSTISYLGQTDQWDNLENQHEYEDLSVLARIYRYPRSISNPTHCCEHTCCLYWRIGTPNLEVAVAVEVIKILPAPSYFFHFFLKEIYLRIDTNANVGLLLDSSFSLHLLIDLMTLRNLIVNHLFKHHTSCKLSKLIWMAFSKQSSKSSAIFRGLSNTI